MLSNLRAALILPTDIHVEGLVGGAALRRARELARRTVRDLPGMNGVALLTALVAVPVWTALFLGLERLEAAIAPSRLSGVGPVAVTGVAGLLAAPLLVASVPLFGVTVALLYFRTREAGGESLADIRRAFEGETPDGWQIRIGERVRERIDSGG